MICTASLGNSLRRQKPRRSCCRRAALQNPGAGSLVPQPGLLLTWHGFLKVQWWKFLTAQQGSSRRRIKGFFALSSKDQRPSPAPACPAEAGSGMAWAAQGGVADHDLEIENQPTMLPAAFFPCSANGLPMVVSGVLVSVPPPASTRRIGHFRRLSS